MNTHTPATAAQHTPTLPRLAVMACPDHAGKHPFHDQRWIVTEGTEIDFGHDPRPGQWSTRNGSLVAMMRDCAPGTAQAIVRAVNSHAQLVAALERAILIIEKAKPYVRDHACMTCDDMSGLGGDPGDAYWLEIAEKYLPTFQAALSQARAPRKGEA